MELLYKHVFENYVVSNGISSDVGEVVWKEKLNDTDYLVRHERGTIVVECDDTKTSLKFFSYTNVRTRAKKYFKKTRYLLYVTYNSKTKNFYFGHVGKLQNKKKRVKSIRVNNLISNSVTNVIRMAYNEVKSYKGKSVWFNGLPKDSEEYVIFQNALKVFANHIGVRFEDNKLDNREFIKFYLDSNNIKYPNNYGLFFTPDTYTGKVNHTNKTFLRKNQNKLVDSFMNANDLKGSKLKKFLHTAENINVNFICCVRDLIGQDYFEQESDEFYSKMFYESRYKNYIGNVNFDSSTLSKQERKNLLELTKLSLNGNINIRDLVDHVNFYTYVKTNGGEIKIKARDKREFRDEHILFTDLHQSYSNGYYTRKYDENLVNEIEKPIFNFLGISYYPVVLKTTTDYNEESSVQNNCVRTYMKTPSSFIVSLRESSSTGDRRLTIEYKVYNHYNKIEFKRVQTRAKFNEEPNSIYDSTLEILDKRFVDYFKKNKFEQFVISKKIPNTDIVREWKTKYLLVNNNNPNDVWTIGWEIESVPKADFIYQDNNLFYL